MTFNLKKLSSLFLLAGMMMPAKRNSDDNFFKLNVIFYLLYKFYFTISFLMLPSE